MQTRFSWLFLVRGPSTCFQESRLFLSYGSALLKDLHSAKAGWGKVIPKADWFYQWTPVVMPCTKNWERKKGLLPKASRPEEMDSTNCSVL